MLLGHLLIPGSIQTQLLPPKNVETFLFITSDGDIFSTSAFEPLEIQPSQQ